MSALRNGGFEADWSEEESHKCLVVPKGAAIYFTDVGNVFTPPGWVTWFRHDDIYAQPEVRDARASVDPARVHSGEKGMLLFTFGRRHAGGFYQAVPAVHGETYRFAAWAHAWSNHKDTEYPDWFPHPDDARWSEGAGYESVMWEAGSQLCNTGDRQQDARCNFEFAIGIDPTGGLNPTSTDVVWSDVYHIYNGFHRLEVEAEARSEYVTVYLASSTKYAYKHNDAYWDDAELTKVGEQPPVECEPRVPYARTYWLASPKEKIASLMEIADPVPDVFRWTVGSSADDAGHGPGCSDRNVIATSPEDWEDDLYDFFQQYYPGVDYTSFSWETARQLSGRLLSAGLRLYGVKLAWPLTRQDATITCEFGVDRGTYMHEGLDLRASWMANKDQVLSATAGKVLRAGYYDEEPWYGHQVRIQTPGPLGLTLLVRYAHLVSGSAAVNVGDMVQVGQMLGKPDNTGNSTGDHLHIDVRVTGPDIPASTSLYADPQFLIEFPDGSGDGEQEVEPVFPKEAVGVFGMHRLGSYEGYDEFIALCAPGFKTVLDISAMGYVHQRSPHTELVYRQWIPDQDRYRLSADASGFVRHDSWLQNVVDHCRQAGIPRVWVESLNETYSHSFDENEGNPPSIRFDLAFLEEISRWNARYDDLDIRPVVFCAAVGNPQMPNEGGGPEMWEMLLPLAKRTQELKGAFGYHAYWAANLGDPSIYQRTAKYLQNRWIAFDDWLITQGVYVYWILGETGACKGWTWIDEQGHEHVAFDPGSGWQRTGSLNKMWTEARDTMGVWRRRNETHGGRLLVGNVFQSGSGDPAWKSFALEGDNLTQFARWTREYWG